MNVIELVEKYLPVLDEQYKREARSSVLDVAPAFVQETSDAKKVKIAKMDVDGLADYSRDSGFTTGAMDLTWEEHEFKIDRGRALQVDAMDNEETFRMAFGRLAGEFQRVKVVPEIDAYRFSEYYKKAGTKVSLTISSGAILKFIDDADAQMDDDEVPEENRILFVNPQVYKAMMNDPSIEKNISVDTVTEKGISKKIVKYNDHQIIKVPSARFLTGITMLDGKTAGQTHGGYVPATGAKVIGMMMIHPSAVLQLSKRRIARIWAPTRAQAQGTDGVNPNADAWKFDFRIYHDAWSLEEKLAGVYAATIEGDGIQHIVVEEGSYNSGTGVWTKGGTTYKVNKEGSTYMVTGTIPHADADAAVGLDAGNRLQLKIKNTAIANRDALPSGNVVRISRPGGTFFEYSKAAFEEDGSLIMYSNVDQQRTITVDITWTTGNTVTYVFNTLGATLAAE